MTGRMIRLNQKYLSCLSEQYTLESVHMFEDDLSVYRVKSKRKTFWRRFFEDIVYLVLCNDYVSPPDIDWMLDVISEVEKKEKVGSSYLCIVPMYNPTKEACTWFNGKTFVHFILLDRQTNSLLFDRGYYYSGMKHVKQMIDIYQECFEQEK